MEASREGPAFGGRIDRARAIALAITVAGVSLAVVRMARIAGRSSHTQYSDYWPMLDDLLAEGGGIRWRGLLEARNEHPILVPKLLYLLNVGLTDGDNHGQAAIVIGLALVLVALVGMLARGTPGMGRAARVAMVVTSAFVILAPHGTWSYAKAMSGTAWLTANVFVVGAVLAQQRDRRVLAPLLGVLACASYGTGLAVWPALAVAGALRHGRRWQDQWPVWATGGVVTAAYLQWYLGGPRATPGADLTGTIKTTTKLMAGAVASGRTTVPVAIFAVACTGLALWACRDRLAIAAPWVSLIVFAGCAAFLIGRSRPGGGSVSSVTFGAGLQSRYWTIVAWAWIGLVGLAVVALRDRPVRAAIPIVLLVVVATGGRDVPASLLGDHENTDLVAAGMVLDLADGRRLGGSSSPFPTITERARALGHQPFDGTFDMDCGLLGEEVTVQPTLPEGVEGSVRNDPRPDSPGVASFSGTVTNPGGHVECVVIVDPEGTVVGTGPARRRGDPDVTVVKAIAPVEYLLTVAVRLEPGGPLYAVPKVPGLIPRPRPVPDAPSDKI